MMIHIHKPKQKKTSNPLITFITLNTK